MTSLFEKVIICVIWARINVVALGGGAKFEKDISAEKQKKKKNPWISQPDVNRFRKTDFEAETGQGKKETVCLNMKS